MYTNFKQCRVQFASQKCSITNSSHNKKATTDLFVLNCSNGSEGEIVTSVRKSKEIFRFQQTQKACYTCFVVVSNCPKSI